jgi:serine/threonine protein phosphatase 1
VDTTALSDLLVSQAAMEGARVQLRSLIPGSHVEFFASLDLVHHEEDYLFVHAGLRPGVAPGEQKENDLIWIRNDFLNSDANFGKIVVHGHSVIDRPILGKNKIGIDTGAWRSDVLTCLMVDGEQRCFLST